MDAEAQSISYPTLADLHAALVQLVEATPSEKRPAAMPALAHDAAVWLRKQFAPPKHSDSPRQRAGRWTWPYADNTLRYAGQLLAAEPDMQRLILAAAEDGIWWRGDDREMFQRIIGETLKMREDPEKYKREASQRMKATISQLTSSRKETRNA